MRAWLVRAGRHGEREQWALDNSCVVVGWDEIGDLSVAQSRDEVFGLLHDRHPEAAPKTLANHAAQLWAFASRIEIGDLVVLPLKSTPALAMGRVTGRYEYVPTNPAGAVQTRPVEWVRTDIPRTTLGQDLLYSLGAFMTVCEIRRNGAVTRFNKVLETGRDPGAASVVGESLPAPVDIDIDEQTASVDIEQLSTDRMRAFISERFTGHDLARLVEAVLNAQGLFTFRAPPGADGGVDILGGSGPLGMESPRICVQVKSGDAPVDVKVVRELHGVLSSVNADQGLLVAWSGLTKPAEIEARSQFFRLRVWSADDVISAVTAVYDLLPDEMQAELPLKRIWTVVLEDAGS